MCSLRCGRSWLRYPSVVFRVTTPWFTQDNSALCLMPPCNYQLPLFCSQKCLVLMIKSMVALVIPTDPQEPPEEGHKEALYR